MSTAPNGFVQPKTDWKASDAPVSSDLTRIEGNTDAIENGSRTIDPAQAPTGNAGTLRNFLDWFANRIKAILGTTNWYDAPPTTLTAAKSHIDAANPHSGSASTTDLNNHAANASAHHARYTDAEAVAAILANDGAGSGLDADMVDGKHASDLTPVTGTYTGDGASSRTISLGFTPSIVMVERKGVAIAEIERAIATSEQNAYHPDQSTLLLSITSGGFIVYYSASGATVKTNTSGSVYKYIAFK